MLPLAKQSQPQRNQFSNAIAIQSDQHGIDTWHTIIGTDTMTAVAIRDRTDFLYYCNCLLMTDCR